MAEAFISALMQPRPPHHGGGGDRDLDYTKWKHRVSYLTTLNNYFAMLFLVVHPLVMVVAYDFWANYHYLMLAHSIQQLMLGCFIWAIPDPKYQYWLKN